jgi:hypothetical protein
MYRNKQGFMIGDENEVLEVWAEENNYFGPEYNIEVLTLQ